MAHNSSPCPSLRLRGASSQCQCTYTAVLVPIGVAFHFKARDLSRILHRSSRLCEVCRRKCRWPAIHPMSKFALVWSLITMSVDATYTAFIVPIGIAFHFKAQYFSWYNAVDIAAGKPCCHSHLNLLREWCLTWMGRCQASCILGSPKFFCAALSSIIPQKALSGDAAIKEARGCSFKWHFVLLPATARSSEFGSLSVTRVFTLWCELNSCLASTSSDRKLQSVCSCCRHHLLDGCHHGVHNRVCGYLQSQEARDS